MLKPINLVKNSFFLILIVTMISCNNDDPETTDEETTTTISSPERIASFGPNGTHWPNIIPTPFMYDNDVVHKIEVECSWDAVKQALENVTDEMANAGTLILIKPGTLVGDGVGGSGNHNAVLSDLGHLDWKKRVTIAPLDGYGSINIIEGVKFYKTFNIAVAGFNIDGGFQFMGCSQSAVAWCKVEGWSACHGLDDFSVENIEIVELVHPDSKVQNGDTSNISAGGGSMDHIYITGCYYAPRFYTDPAPDPIPHTDTLQFAPGGGEQTNIYFIDSALFSSNNCSLQTGGIDGLFLEHSYIVSGETSLSRYPHLPGGSTDATTSALNGSGKNFEALNSTLIGGLTINTNSADFPWSKVTNTLVNSNKSGSSTPLEGEWTVDTSLNASNSNMPPYPTDDYLNSIWGK